MVDMATVRAAAGRLAERFDPEQIILFGSYARGTADDKSDVDLLVLCEFEGKRRDVMVEMDRALRGCGFARDIIAMTPEEFEVDRQMIGTIARPAWQEGVVLYDKNEVSVHNI